MFVLGAVQFHGADVSNVFLLNLPSESDEAGQFIKLDTMLETLRCVVDAWSPEWALVSTSSIDDLAADLIPRAGWITYVPKHAAALAGAAFADELAFADGSIVVAAPSIDSVDPSVIASVNGAIASSGPLSGFRRPEPH